MPSSRATAVTVLPVESTSAIASRLNSAVYRFVYLLPTWCYFLWNLMSQSPGVHNQGEGSVEGDHTAEGVCNNHPRAGLVQFGANFVADAFADVVVKAAVDLAHEAQQPAAHVTTEPPVRGDEGAGDGARYIGDAEPSVSVSSRWRVVLGGA